MECDEVTRNLGIRRRVSTRKWGSVDEGARALKHFKRSYSSPDSSKKGLIDRGGSLLSVASKKPFVPLFQTLGGKGICRLVPNQSIPPRN